MAAEDLQDVQLKGKYGNFLSRYQQTESVHQLLANGFFSNLEKVNHMYDNSTYYMRGTSTMPEGNTERTIQEGNRLRSLNPLNILNISIRVLSFHVEMGETLKIRIIKTLPVVGFYCTNRELIQEWIQTDDDAIKGMIQKLMNDITVDELQPGSYFYSYDIFFRRNNITSGIWHRDYDTDAPNSLGNNPSSISLEYFLPTNVPDKPNVILGPEIIQVFNSDSSKPVIESIQSAISRGGVMRRVLIHNGSVVTLDNKGSYHASPYTGIAPSIKFSSYDPSKEIYETYGDPTRFEKQTSEFHQSVTRYTNESTRSFIRGWREDAPPFDDRLEELDISEWLSTLKTDPKVWNPAAFVKKRHSVGGRIAIDSIREIQHKIPVPVKTIPYKPDVSKTKVKDIVLKNFVIKKPLIVNLYAMDEISWDEISKYSKLEVFIGGTKKRKRKGKSKIKRSQKL
jgi:hypothetical protein